ncbi:hypothetical protein HNQ58_001595 [Rehaibacterium terrae]|uniref:Uncharacterized protein n=1 Tax=Rehaibacterium terrae TaxID=1341696 RepID=A0A7W8DEE2_9GAMM|nr:hypothetical protein [Rehaibacterium terrae]
MLARPGAGATPRPNGIEVLALELRPEPTPETLEEAVA